MASAAVSASSPAGVAASSDDDGAAGWACAVRAGEVAADGSSGATGTALLLARDSRRPVTRAFVASLTVWSARAPPAASVLGPGSVRAWLARVARPGGSTCAVGPAQP